MGRKDFLSDIANPPAPDHALQDSVGAAGVVIFDQEHNELRQLAERFSRTDGFELIAACSSVDDAADAVRAHLPAVCIVSLDHPGEAIALVSQLASDTRPTQFVFLCRDTVSELVTNGDIILPRSEAASALPSYVQQLLHDHPPFSSLPKNFGGDCEQSPDIELEPLMPRECEIKGLLLEDLSNKEIARELDIAEGTVKIHVHKILKKLSATNRRALMAAARHDASGESAQD